MCACSAADMGGTSSSATGLKGRKVCACSAATNVGWSDREEVGVRVCFVGGMRGIGREGEGEGVVCSVEGEDMRGACEEVCSIEVGGGDVEV